MSSEICVRKPAAMTQTTGDEHDARRRAIRASMGSRPCAADTARLAHAAASVRLRADSARTRSSETRKMTTTDIAEP